MELFTTGKVSRVIQEWHNWEEAGPVINLTCNFDISKFEIKALSIRGFVSYLAKLNDYQQTKIPKSPYRAIE